MSNITILEIQHFKAIIEKCELLEKLLVDDEKLTINKLKNKYNSLINNFNNENILVANKTKKEIGRFKSSVKKIIVSELCLKADWLDYEICDNCTDDEGFYYTDELCDKCKENVIFTDKYNDKNDLIIKKYHKKCDEVQFGEIEDEYILLSRKIKNIYNPDPLEIALKEIIRTRIISKYLEFNN
jgi:hypothetical protein